MADLHDWVPHGGSPANEWACWRCGWVHPLADREIVEGLCPGSHMQSKGRPAMLRAELSDDQLTVLLCAAAQRVDDRLCLRDGHPDRYAVLVAAGHQLINQGLATRPERAAGWIHLEATEAGRWQLHLRSLLTGAPAPSTSWIKPGVTMRHHSGRLYEVLDVSNQGATDPVKFPVTAHYRGADGNTWSRSIASMAGKFTPADLGDIAFEVSVASTKTVLAAAKPKIKRGDVRWRRDTGLRFRVEHKSLVPGDDDPIVFMRSEAGTTWSGPASAVAKEFTDVRPLARGDQVWHRKSDRNYIVESIERGGPDPVAVLRSRCGRVWRGPIDSALQAFQNADLPAELPFKVGDFRWCRTTGLRFVFTRILDVAGMPEPGVVLVAEGLPCWTGSVSQAARAFTDIDPASRARVGTPYWRRDTGQRYVLTDRKPYDAVVLTRDDGIRWTGPERHVAEMFHDYAPTRWLEHVGSSVKTPGWGPKPTSDDAFKTAAARADEAINRKAWLGTRYDDEDLCLVYLNALRNSTTLGLKARAAIGGALSRIRELRKRLLAEAPVDVVEERDLARREVNRLLALAQKRGDELEATHGDLKTAREKQTALAAEVERLQGYLGEIKAERDKARVEAARLNELWAQDARRGRRWAMGGVYF